MTGGTRTVLAVGALLALPAWLAACSARAAQTPSVTAAQPVACLHGANESDGQRTRRLAALRLTRTINTAEAQRFSVAGSFGPLEDLQGLSETPDGFEVQLAADAASYAFAVKDSLDPCGFAYFSDQNGLIYTGEPIR